MLTPPGTPIGPPEELLFMDGFQFVFFAKSSKTSWVFYLNFLFQPKRTKNNEMRAKTV
jgi:hypothetical protein